MAERSVHSTCLVLSLLLTPASANAGDDRQMRKDMIMAERPNGCSQEKLRRAALLYPGSTIEDMLSHPAFREFAERLLPWDGRSYDPSLRLRDIRTLLPYHSHVEPAVVAAGLNRMIADTNAGQTVFYDIYSEADKWADPEKAHTALFFFGGRPGAPFAIIAPGGGFAYVGSVHEGFPYAEEISGQGYNAFVLKYRAGKGGRIATEDLAFAIIHFLKRRQSRRRNLKLFCVGQFGGGTHGRIRRLPWCRNLWR